MTGQAPNILLLVADQLTALALSIYGNRVCRTPHLAALADQGIVFDNAYCNFPLCAPSRYAMLAGQLASRVGGYDNASELPAATPTLPYYLASLGYHTSLSGKMHFVGPDQLHGYHERLTTDIYPSDFGWTPDWRQPVPYGPSGMSMRSVVESGLCVRSLQFDYDDEVANQAVQKVFDLARRRDARPFFLTVSFTHPHNPYVTSREWWDLYADDQIDAPRVPAIPYDKRDPHSQRLHWLFRQDEHAVTDADVRRARHAYYANISYVDAQVGRVLQTLEQTGLDKNTIVVFTADHGEMLGERGLWYKYTLLEPALRVPLVYRIPGHAPRRCTEPVSHVDLLPTLIDLATQGRVPEPIDALDGASLVPALQGGGSVGRVVAAEFTAEGAIAPMVSVRRGDHKLIVSPADPPQLFDLAADPLEMNNLAPRVEFDALRAGLQAEIDSRWNLERLNTDVLRSQKRRRWIQQQLVSGEYPAWDHQPFVDASAQFVRGGGRSSPTMVKGLARFPYVEPSPVERPRVLDTAPPGAGPKPVIANEPPGQA
jgi:choline-sulfatase